MKCFIFSFFVASLAFLIHLFFTHMLYDIQFTVSCMIFSFISSIKKKKSLCFINAVALKVTKDTSTALSIYSCYFPYRGQVPAHHTANTQIQTTIHARSCSVHAAISWKCCIYTFRFQTFSCTQTAWNVWRSTEEGRHGENVQGHGDLKKMLKVTKHSQTLTECFVDCNRLKAD